MTLSHAQSIFPELRTSEADSVSENQSLYRLSDWCSQFSPWTAPDEEGSGTAFSGGGSAWIDITGSAHLFGGEDALLHNITSRLSRLGYTAYAAVADTPGAAWATARYAHHECKPWKIVPKGKTQDALAPIPVSALRLTLETIIKLRSVGLKQIGDLIPVSRTALTNRFGNEVINRLDQALGKRPEPISPIMPSSPYYTRVSFTEPIGRTEDITEAITNLAQNLAVLLEADGLGTCQLSLSFYYPNGTINRLPFITSRASRNVSHFTQLLTSKIENIEATFGIETIMLTAIKNEKLPPTQMTLEKHADKDESDIAELSDRLSNRLGHQNVVRLVLNESHIPERTVKTFPATTANSSPPTFTCSINPSTKRKAIHRPRPLRLLSQPEKVEAIVPTPDSPPVMFRWRKKNFQTERADGPERITQEWWNDDLEILETGLKEIKKSKHNQVPASSIQDIIRDYYRIEDHQGRHFWLYKEGIYRPGKQPDWYVHGIFG